MYLLQKNTTMPKSTLLVKTNCYFMLIFLISIDFFNKSVYNEYTSNDKVIYQTN